MPRRVIFLRRFPPRNRPANWQTKPGTRVGRRSAANFWRPFKPANRGASKRAEGKQLCRSDTASTELGGLFCFHSLLSPADRQKSILTGGPFLGSVSV